MYQVVLIDATESPIERPKKTKVLLRRQTQTAYLTESPIERPKKTKVLLRRQTQTAYLKEPGWGRKSRRIICPSFCIGKQHNCSLYKESNTHLHPLIRVVRDSGYQGLQKLHANALMPKKRKKNQALTQEETKHNRAISSQRTANQNVIEMVKGFKIISDHYRNRRKRSDLRFNLIAGMYILECSL